MNKRTFCIWLTIISAFLACTWKSTYAADDANAAARATLERIQALRKDRPNDGVLVYYEAAFQSQVGQSKLALELLRSLKGRKLGLIPTRDLGFDAVWDDKEFQIIRKELADEDAKTPDAPVAFRLKDPKLIPEGIAYDPTNKRFFLGSIAQHKIIVTDAKGEAHDFPLREINSTLFLGSRSMQRVDIYMPLARMDSKTAGKPSVAMQSCVII